MKKIDYLKLVIKNPLHQEKSWILSAFAITKTNGNSHPADVRYLKLVRTDLGYFFYNDKAELEKIDDGDLKFPLFSFSDKITVDSSWIINAPEPIETYIGNLFFNLYSIVPAFGTKFSFVTGRVSVSKIENQIAPKLLDTEPDPSKKSNQYFYVDEYLKFVDSLQFISTLSQITTYAGTRKALLPPEGIDAFKKELIKKYEGKLNNPIELFKFEAELKKFDIEYLKDDPSFGKFLSGKVLNTSRKELFLSVGAKQGFTDSSDVAPIINSLNEGWPTEPEQITTMFNSVRYGSFGRGAETVKGGVSAKILLRAANGFKLIDKDCGTTLGIKRIYNETNQHQLEGRYILQGSKSLLMENKTYTDNYLNKELYVRSPMYCKLEGDNFCRLCSGEKLFRYKNGLAIPLTEVSGIILGASMSLVHTAELKTSKLNIQKVFS